MGDLFRFAVKQAAARGAAGLPIPPDPRSDTDE
jgi:hypothetical protein